MWMVTCLRPQLKTMIPPRATARTTAAEVQLFAVPLPISRVGCEVFTGFPAAGTGAWPAGLPYEVALLVVVAGLVVAGLVVAGLVVTCLVVTCLVAVLVV